MQEIQISERTIDLEKVIRSKSEKLYRRLPKFVLRYLNRILHVDEMNDFLFHNKHLMGIDFATGVLDSFGCHILLKGEEHIQSGRYILVANHPLGGLDGMAIISKVGEIRKDILFPVNDFLMALPNLRPLFIPIDKTARLSKKHHALNQAFEGSEMLLYFPAGLCSRKQKQGIIEDLEWKKTFVTKAKESRRDVIPMYVSGKNSKFFYNFANWRRRLGIRFNLEQLFLVDEMFKQKGQTIELLAGKPIPYTVFDSRFSDKEWAQIVKQHVYSLGKDRFQSFDKTIQTVCKK